MGVGSWGSVGGDIAREGTSVSATHAGDTTHPGAPCVFDGWEECCGQTLVMNGVLDALAQEWSAMRAQGSWDASAFVQVWRIIVGSDDAGLRRPLRRYDIP